MSKLNEVLTALDDFRTDLFTSQQSPEALLTPASMAMGLRGLMGQVVSPLENVHATGVGIRTKNGKVCPADFVLKVYVFQKLTGLGTLTPRILAAPYHGVDIDIEELPIMQAMAKKPTVSARTTSAQHRARRRPIPGGVEIQPRGASFVGTLGGIVRSTSGESGPLFALSNNHVLADTNQISPGREITQPFSNSVNAVFARLTAFEPIHLATPGNPFPSRNYMDAAIARVIDKELVRTGAIFGIPNYTPTLMSPSPNMKVIKSGRTTAVTTGRITATLVNGVKVNFGTDENPIIGTFDRCIQIVGDSGSFCARGDSGSFILERSSGRPVALLFAGDSKTTTACDLTAVCTRFSVLPV